MSQYLTLKNSGSIPLQDIPNLSYHAFSDAVVKLMERTSSHCINYFCYESSMIRKLIACIADDETHEIHVLTHSLEQNENRLNSLSMKIPALHRFERDISDRYQLHFENHPWLKPVRFPSNYNFPGGGMNSYPFYSIDGEDLHEVAVGPVHAGIIEPGHFRFICNGETVLNLEIQLGYQHRGIEKLMISMKSMLQQIILAENIAGDTVIGHSLAASNIYESLLKTDLPECLILQRVIALELERIAMHLGDTAALCTDVAYQLGQVSCEALRTMVINGMQFWCGNRFGKGLIRPFGTDYPMTDNIATKLSAILEEVKLRYSDITHRVFSLPSILDRFESIGKVSLTQANQIGAVGMVAKSSGLKRDIRSSHPSGYYSRLIFEPIVLENGDVWARAMLRNLEIIQSITLVSKILNNWVEDSIEKPGYSVRLPENMLAISLVESWRGEICHIGLTDSLAAFSHYSIKGPSFHNWTALSLAMRNQEISDFPLCNKSFNLSYCGHDL
jgi:Ni,Fe-hydrogenase III large subunit